jgi:hypothetical protein
VVCTELAPLSQMPRRNRPSLDTRRRGPDANFRPISPAPRTAPVCPERAPAAGWDAPCTAPACPERAPAAWLGRSPYRSRLSRARPGGLAGTLPVPLLPVPSAPRRPIWDVPLRLRPGRRALPAEVAHGDAPLKSSRAGVPRTLRHRERVAPLLEAIRAADKACNSAPCRGHGPSIRNRSPGSCYQRCPSHAQSKIPKLTRQRLGGLSRPRVRSAPQQMHRWLK